MKRRFAWIGIVVVAAIACGPAAPSAQPSAAKQLGVAEIAAYQNADRQTLLEGGARREGKLVWYTSLAGEIVDRLADGYKKTYPFIQDVQILRGAENELVTKATQEDQAGQPGFDVMESQITAIRLLFDAKLMTPYYSPALSTVPATFVTKRGDLYLSATDRVSLISFGYNTNLLPASAVPQKIEDLMNPALAGKLALAGTTTGHRWVGSILNALGDEQGRQFLSRFATQQKPTVQQVSGKALLDLIAKGEVAASPTIFNDHVALAAAEKKAPVKWVPIEPVIGNTGQVGVASKGQHPHAAMLFVDYLFGDGIQVFHANQYLVASDKIAFQVWVPETGKTTDEIERDAKTWSALFKSTFR